MNKFEDVDVIASLEAIMKQNTAFYQSDFEIDKRILTLIETFYRKRRQAPQPRTGGFYGFPARPGRAASGSATFF